MYVEKLKSSNFKSDMGYLLYGSCFWAENTLSEPPSCIIKEKLNGEF
jgi:hypothetical protein